MAIKRRIEIRTHTHQVVRINRGVVMEEAVMKDASLKGWCARCGQEVEVVKLEKPDLRLSRKKR